VATENSESVIRQVDLVFAVDGHLTDGGQGSLRWTYGPWGSDPRLYKSYKSGVVHSGTRRLLEKAVRFPSELDEETKALVLERTAWPQYLVLGKDGWPAGVIIPGAPASFWRTDRYGGQRPRELSELVATRDRADQLGKDFFSLPQILARLGHLLETLSFLHDAGFVLHDLRHQNVLTTGLDHPPAVYVVDCDSGAIDGENILSPVMVPEVVGSEGAGALASSPSSDLSLFALLVVKLLERRLELEVVPESVGMGVLREPHLALLRALAANDAGPVAGRNLRAVAQSWKGCVGRDGTEYGRPEVGLRFAWPACDVSVPGPRRSPSVVGPALLTARPDANANPTPNPKKVSRPSRLRSAVKTAVLVGVFTWLGWFAFQSTVVRRRPSLSSGSTSASSLTTGKAFGATPPSSAQTSRSSTAAPGSPNAVPLEGGPTLQAVMSDFSERFRSVGTLQVSAPDIKRISGGTVISIWVIPTAGDGRGVPSERLSYTCSTRQSGLGKSLVAVPYLVVDGSPYIEGEQLAADWDGATQTNATWSLFSPLCRFANGASVPFSLRAGSTGLSGGSRRSIQLLFGLSRTDLTKIVALIWVISKDSYLLGRVP